MPFYSSEDPSNPLIPWDPLEVPLEPRMLTLDPSTSPLVPLNPLVHLYCLTIHQRAYVLMANDHMGPPRRLLCRVWHLVSRLLGIETFLNFLRVSVSVSKKSLSISLKNNWSRKKVSVSVSKMFGLKKKSRYRSRKFWSRKKVPVSVSKIFGRKKKSRYRSRNFWSRKKVSVSVSMIFFGLVTQCY